MYEIIVLGTAETYIRNQDNKMKAKILRTIELLSEFGPYLTMPHSRKLKGYELYELRIQQSSNIARLFYFHSNKKIYVITSGYSKKTMKTDKKEILRAISLKESFLKDE